ncbi:MAG: SET domain-containing protein-lysine N-methyltransferase [Candidatus Moranbacteria bacterium]|nr:SET domain-containing protein-lysine N-methyltransferase [Candidatus Moranbacteria bacterium]
MSATREQQQSPFVHVKRASAGLGLFALAPIKKGTTIIEYIGERVPTEVGDERDNRYMFNINTKWDIDGSPRHNTARYANHSCRPNCEAINRRGRIFIVAKRSINVGEELTYHYGKDHFTGFIKPLGCRCARCSL